MTETTSRVLPDREGWLDLLDRFGAAALSGVVTGLLVGGVGGRLAMFVLRLTSPDTLHGLETDDGFEIGLISSGTAFLLAITTLLGTVLAFAYLLVRRWLPASRRPLQAAVFAGIVGGAAIVKPDGLDFTLLEPPALAIALFVALPAVYGWAMASMVEHLIARPGHRRKARVAATVLFVGVGFLGTVPVLIAAVGVVLVLVGRRWPALADAVVSPVPTWVVRVALVLIAAISAVGLLQDSADILG